MKKDDLDNLNEKFRKWIFCADQMYFGSRSAFINGYNMSAIISANYAVEFYLKTLMVYLGISFQTGNQGHNLIKLLEKLESDQYINDILTQSEKIDDSEREWLKKLHEDFGIRYPDSWPKKDLEFTFKINKFDAIIRKLRNLAVIIANNKKIDVESFDPIFNAMNNEEQFKLSIFLRRGGIHHTTVFSRFNYQTHLFKTFSKKIKHLDLY